MLQQLYHHFFLNYVLYCSSAIYANRHYLNIYHRTNPDRLAVNGADKPLIYGDVYIHPSASVHPTAVVCIQYLRV